MRKNSLSYIEGEDYPLPLILEFDFDGDPARPYILAAPFAFHSQSVAMPVVEVPTGYRTDFASIPRFFWRVLPPVGRHSKAAVIHDWLCDAEPKACDHIQAAEIFGRAMAALRVGRAKRAIMVWAVRYFGPRFQRSSGGGVGHA